MRVYQFRHPGLEGADHKQPTAGASTIGAR